MAASAPPLVFSTAFEPHTGEPVPVAPGLVRVTAPNASAYTFTGTNTFIAGDGPVAIIDPGPDDAEHLEAILKAVDGREIAAIVLTHTHRDHCAMVPRLMTITGAPLWFGVRRRPVPRSKGFARAPAAALVPDRVLENGDRLVFGTVALDVVETPGHAPDHLAFALSGTDFILVGDHVMGWSSTIVAAPDGNLADYLASIETLHARAETRYIPAHGGEIADGRKFARAIKAHRLMRNTQLLEALGSGGKSLPRLTQMIYPQLAGRVRTGAQRTILAHALYLEEQGKVRIGSSLLGTRITLA